MKDYKSEGEILVQQKLGNMFQRKTNKCAIIQGWFNIHNWTNPSKRGFIL